MRRLTGCAAVALVLLPGVAVAATTLSLNTARRVTVQIARQDARHWRGYPKLVHHTRPSCVRHPGLARPQITCEYAIVRRAGRDRHGHKVRAGRCQRRVEVTLVGGLPHGQRARLNCRLELAKSDPDYEG